MDTKKKLQFHDTINSLTTLCDGLPSEESLNNNGQQENSSSSNNGNINISSLHGEHSIYWKLRKNLVETKSALFELQKLQEDEIGTGIQARVHSIGSIFEDLINKDSTSTLHLPTRLKEIISSKEKQLQDINKDVKKLKRQIPSLQKRTSASVSHHNSQSSNGVGTTVEEESLWPILEDSSICEDIKRIFDGLDENQKKCLACFSVFPEDEEITKKLMTCWWLGEGFIKDSEGENSAEKSAGEILDLFKKKGLIEVAASRKLRSGEAKSFRIHPLVRCVLIELAKKRGFFAYDLGGNRSPIFSRFCFVREQLRENNGADSAKQSSHGKRDSEEQALETLFNVNERFPDRRLERLSKTRNVNSNSNVVDWLSKMKNLKVLYLGRWQTSVNHHIEVDSVQFLKGLKSLSKLRLLSLQGISRINELPDCLKKLVNLEMLDLKACHNLEALPKCISSLQNLTHLDVSECYLLDHMPKELSSLINLKVLKGFVIGDKKNQSGKKSCALKDLTDMKKLRKLSISTSRMNVKFPTGDELAALNKLEMLKKLSLAWVGNSKQRKEETRETVKRKLIRMTRIKSQIHLEEAERRTTLMIELEKLELQCFPDSEIPKWLKTCQIKSLKQFYIRGGSLRDLGKDKFMWDVVEDLRLKFLSELRMNWREMQALFPKLKYLEKVDCPRVTFCPCNESGVWLN